MTAPITNNTLYRFRTLNSLLGEYEELEKQSIFFAPPKLLNDPMEGLRLIHFKGDEVLWNNFFKHYLLTLLHHAMGVVLIGEKEDLSESIQIGFHTSTPPDHVRNLFPNASTQLAEHSLSKEIINFLTNHRDEISEVELIPYLTLLHHLALFIVFETMKKNSLIDKPPYEDYESKLAEPAQMFQSQIDLLKAHGDGWISEMSEQTRNAFEEMELIQLIEGDNSKNWQLLSSGFPRRYLKEIHKLMYGNWYTACFMTDSSNSSVWGNYAEKHTGVCLVYDVNPLKSSNCYSLMLGNVTLGHSWSKHSGLVKNKGNRSFEFHDIDYDSKPTSINFFEYLGRLPQGIADSSWFTFEGERSKHSITFDDDKRKKYWATRTDSLTTKSKDWEYENEKRLILDELLGGLPESGSTFTYDFKSLKGMIFGINTPTNKKLEIYNIIERKVKENRHVCFKFYQAYYCERSDTIEHKELSILNKKLIAACEYS